MEQSLEAGAATQLASIRTVPIWSMTVMDGPPSFFSTWLQGEHLGRSGTGLRTTQRSYQQPNGTELRWLNLARKLPLEGFTQGGP